MKQWILRLLFAVTSTVVPTKFWMWRMALSIVLIASKYQPANALWQLLFLPTILAGSDLLIPNEYWLPGEVVPVHYDFELVVHMESLTTRGEVKVELVVVKATSSITLHANSSFVKIDHRQVSVESKGLFTIPVKGYKEDGRKSFTPWSWPLRWR